MAHAQFSGGLAVRMLHHQQQLPTYEQQLHVIYLANDVLLKRCTFYLTSLFKGQRKQNTQ